MRNRREFLKTSTGLLAGAAAGEAALTEAHTQEAGAPNADTELARLQTARRILLRGAIVLTLDRQIGDFAQADILIEDGKIREVRPAIAVSADDTAVIDVSERIVIPGFVDTHSHSFEGILRSSLPNGTIFDPGYRETFEDKLIPAFRPDDVHAGVLVTALGMIGMGTTAVVDTSQINHSPEHSDALVHAFQEAGIRTVCAYSRGKGPFSQYPQDVMRLRRSYFNSEDQLLTLAFATSVQPETFAFARENGFRAVLHISNNSQALIALRDAGLMREGDEYIHCAHLNDAAWRAIKETGGRTSHAPAIEMSMGHGMPSIQDAIDHGVRPSLSSDHTKVVAQDMFGIMHAVFDLQRLSILQRARKGEQNLPPLVTPRDVLAFATIEGARCANLDGRIGTLAPGKEADLVVLRADGLDVWPHSNAYGTAANLMNPGHVETVLIAGKVKKWRGRLVGIDLPRVRRLAQQSRDAVMERAGFRIGLLD